MAKSKSYFIVLLTWIFEFILVAVEYIKENPIPKRSDYVEQVDAKASEGGERNSETRNGELHESSIQGE